MKILFLEVTFLEKSYLSVFGLRKPMIYRQDELFQKLFQVLYLPIEPEIWKKFHGGTPSS